MVRTLWFGLVGTVKGWSGIACYGLVSFGSVRKLRYGELRLGLQWSGMFL